MRFKNFELKAPSTYGPITPGYYDVQVTSCEWKENSQHTGEIIVAKLTIIGPAFNGRTLYENFNIRHSSAQAEQIGQQQFSDFTRACGFEEMPDDTDAFLNRILNVKVGVEDINKVELGKEPRNTVLAYRRSEIRPEEPKPANAPVPPWMQRKA